MVNRLGKKIACPRIPQPVPVFLMPVFLMAAFSLEYVTRDIANKGETLIILTSVYSLAAEAEEDAAKRKRWVDKAFEAIQAIKQSGKLAPFIQELNTGEDFEFLREFPEFSKVISNE